MGLRQALVLTVVTAVALPATAELYRYRDRHGVLHFTDNPVAVPPEQRAGLKTYRETVPEPAAAAPVPAQRVTKAAEEERQEERATATNTAARLRQRREALTLEYEALRKERTALARQAGRRGAEDRRQRYDQAVEQLNAKIRAYRQRREDYERAVRAHNARLARQAGGAPFETGK